MDFISKHLIPPFQALSSAQDAEAHNNSSVLAQTMARAICGQPLPGVGSAHLRIVLTMEQNGLCGMEHGCVQGHCFVSEHPGSFRAPLGCEHIPGKSGWAHWQRGIWAFFVMNSSQCQKIERSREFLQSNIPQAPMTLIAGLHLGSRLKIQWSGQQGYQSLASAWCSRASPHLLPVFNLIGITQTHIHTHLPCLVVQLSNSAYSGVLYWNMETFSEALFKISLDKDT